MRKFLLLASGLLVTMLAIAKTIIVHNITELNEANKTAQAGDIIILQNGEWNNVSINLNCSGTSDQPITFKAQTPGKMIITGESRLKLGGNFIIIDGWYFTNGHAGNNAVIDFRINKSHLANNCRVTNCVINDFNNERMQDNYWISFYGKNNRVDHCSFFNKKNMGVLAAVILDDERSRENFHSIDHNYFGFRLPLASNSGEIIRVGVSQHCEFNSNTQITDNLFEHCDGEAEVVSIKSCSNVVRNNLFKECQGSVVLRHGNYNTVEGNIFLGNDKEASGGVRVINKGQWVVNNLFYKCRGTGFRSPLAIMNGIPNSPAFRYVQVTDAVIANNTFYNCSPASFCEGSDTERVLPPANVQMLNNVFYNKTDGLVYRAYDNIGGFVFNGNSINKDLKQEVANGFERTVFTYPQATIGAIPASNSTQAVPDSLQKIAMERLGHPLSKTEGFHDLGQLKKVQANAANNCGAKWFVYRKLASPMVKVACKTSTDIEKAIAKNPSANLVIQLTGNSYTFDQPVLISANTTFTANAKQSITFKSADLPHLFEIRAGNILKLQNVSLDLSGLHAMHVITTDTSGSSNHSVFTMTGCAVKNFDESKGSFFYASKSSLCDSIIITHNLFDKNSCELLSFENETGKKGYYNVEKFLFAGNKINGHTGTVLNMLRGGNDESTLGPKLLFKENTFQDCQPLPSDSSAMVHLWGTQQSSITDNRFVNCHNNSILIRYDDAVRATHLFNNNTINNCGPVIKDKFVTEQGNTVN